METAQTEKDRQLEAGMTVVDVATIKKPPPDPAKPGEHTEYVESPGSTHFKPEQPRPRLEMLIEQLLGEFRRQKEQPSAEFAVTKLLGGIAQVLVIAVLFFAYLRSDTPQVEPILLTALVLQTMTIALLLMGR
jgi:hypothetical protein